MTAIKYADTKTYDAMLPSFIVKSWLDGSARPKVPELASHEIEITLKQGNQIFLLHVPEIINRNRLKSALERFFADANGKLAKVAMKGDHYIIF